MANRWQTDGSGFPVPVPVPETVPSAPSGASGASPGVLSLSVPDHEEKAGSTQSKPVENSGAAKPIRGEVVREPTAADLVGEFVDRCTELGEEPIPSDRARVGKSCKELLAAGKSPELISAAVRRMVDRHRPLNSLPYLVGEIERERAGHPVTPRGQPTGGSARLERAIAAVKAERREMV